MYHVGDKVVHPGHGGCVIDAVEERSWNGQTNDFYTLLPVKEGNLKLMVPVNTAKDIGIRNIISREEAQEVLEAIDGLDHFWMDDRRERQSIYDQVMKSDNLIEIAQVIKTLIHHKVHGKITAMDQQILHKGKEKLFSELALSMGCSYEEIEGEVTQKAV